jgi:hypothetical protein
MDCNTAGRCHQSQTERGPADDLPTENGFVEFLAERRKARYAHDGLPTNHQLEPGWREAHSKKYKNHATQLSAACSPPLPPLDTKGAALGSVPARPGWLGISLCNLWPAPRPTETVPLLRIQTTPNQKKRSVANLLLRRGAGRVIVGEGSNGTNGTKASPRRGDVSASSARMLHTISRDVAEWLEFSRGLVIEPVLPRPLLEPVKRRCRTAF